MQAGGGGLIDRAAGSLAKDFKRGAEPGRAYLEGGGTPALTMRGLANKAEAVQETAGIGLARLTTPRVVRLRRSLCLAQLALVRRCAQCIA